MSIPRKTTTLPIANPPVPGANPGVLSEQANQYRRERRVDLASKMATTRRQSTVEKNKQSKEKMGNPKKKVPTPSKSGQSAAAKPLSDEEKTEKLQRQAIQIAFLEKQLNRQLTGTTGIQVSYQNSQASFPDSQASLSEDSASHSEKKRKPPPIVNAVVLSSNGMKKHIKEIVKHEIWRTCDAF